MWSRSRKRRVDRLNHCAIHAVLPTFVSIFPKYRWAIISLPSIDNIYLFYLTTTQIQTDVLADMWSDIERPSNICLYICAVEAQIGGPIL